MTDTSETGVEIPAKPGITSPRFSDVLFMGSVVAPLSWYRTVGPARAIGADWIRYLGDPPETAIAATNIKGQYRRPNYDDYSIIVVQQPEREAWAETISMWRADGKTVLIDIDDAIYDIHNLESHAGKDSFDEDRIKGYRLCLEAASGLIVSTPRLRGVYEPLNSNIHVCRNGIDPERFRFSRVERDTVNVGWSGASGHKEALDAWWPGVVQAMQERPHARLVTLGSPYGEPLWEHLPDRVLSLPYSMMEQHAAAYTNFDIALAPASRHSWHAGKSDLRWLEAAAAGVACLADPFVYDDVQPGETGWLAETPEEVYLGLLHLIDRPAVREQIGDKARAYVTEHRSMARASESWVTCLDSLRV